MPKPIGTFAEVDEGTYYVRPQAALTKISATLVVAKVDNTHYTETWYLPTSDHNVMIGGTTYPFVTWLRPGVNHQQVGLRFDYIDANTTTPPPSTIAVPDSSKRDVWEHSTAKQ